MFLNPEGFTLLFQHYSNINIKGFCFRSKTYIIFVFNRTGLKTGICHFIHALLYKSLIEVSNWDHKPAFINHWTECAVFSF